MRQIKSASDREIVWWDGTPGTETIEHLEPPLPQPNTPPAVIVNEPDQHGYLYAIPGVVALIWQIVNTVT